MCEVRAEWVRAAKKPRPLLIQIVDPGCARVRDEVGIAVSIHIGHHEGDDQIVDVQPLPWRVEEKRIASSRDPGSEFDPIANAVAIEIGAQRIGLREIRDAAARRGCRSSRGSAGASRRSARVNDAVAVQGICDLNPSL